MDIVNNAFKDSMSAVQEVASWWKAFPYSNWETEEAIIQLGEWILTAWQRISSLIIIKGLMWYDKENLERQETNKNGRGDRAALI